jgi:hypothetical protein
VSRELKARPTGLLVAALICFGVGAVSFSGLILRNDTAGRVLFGVAWGTLGVVWFGKYLMYGRAPRDAGPEDESSQPPE